MDFIEMILDPYVYAYETALSIYPTDTVSLAEKIYILESGHYTSKQFLNCMSAGQTASSNVFPYGWPMLSDLWKNPLVSPSGLWTANVSGQQYTYVSYGTFVAGVISLCERLMQLGNDPEAWNGGADPDYLAKINNITNKYVP